MKKHFIMLIFSVLVTCIIYAQQRETISGKVLSESGEQLGGATITIENLGTNEKQFLVADSMGLFSLENMNTSIKYNLVFEHVGYQKETIYGYNVQQGDNSSLLIRMKEEKNSLQEVVVVGYGTQKKENLTGAISQVKMSEVLGDRPVINTTTALQGTIPGLQITRSSTPGQNANSINIRGTLSINGGGPLILIDNVPGDIASLNPEDIETVTVLKDAASAAIYGARAAGGVIIITTKRPKSNARFQLTYNNNFGSEKVMNTPVQSSLQDYLTAYIDAGYNDRYWPNSQSVSKWLAYLKEYKQNPGVFNTIGDGIFVDSTGGIYYMNEKDLYKNFLTNGFLQSHNVSVSGGKENIRYRMSAGYDSENGPLLGKKDTYKRLTAGAFVSADLNKWFTQEMDVRYSQATTVLPSDESGGLYSLRLVSYYPEGNLPASLSLTHQEVPIFTPRNIILNSNTSRLITSTPRLYFKSILKPAKGLEGVFEYTYNKGDNDYSYYSGKWTYSTIQLASTTVPQNDYYIKRRYYTNYNAFNAYLTYTKSFGDHNFKLL